MKNPSKILILGAEPEIIYLVIGSGITMRSVLSSETAAQLLKKEAMDLIIGPRDFFVGAAAWKISEDKAA